ncbi:hypothetical protein Tco_0711408 [Tanacetum coccineum]
MEFHPSLGHLVRVPVANVTLSFSAHLLRENTDSFPSLCYRKFSLGPVLTLGLSCYLPLAAVYASKAAVKSAISCRMASKIMASVLDVDVLLGGILSTQDNTYHGMIYDDGDNDANDRDDDEIKYNIGDGVKIAGEVIGSGDEIVYLGTLSNLGFPVVNPVNIVHRVYFWMRRNLNSDQCLLMIQSHICGKGTDISITGLLQTLNDSQYLTVQKTISPAQLD